MNIHCRLKL